MINEVLIQTQVIYDIMIKKHNLMLGYLCLELRDIYF